MNDAAIHPALPEPLDAAAVIKAAEKIANFSGVSTRSTEEQVAYLATNADDMSGVGNRNKHLLDVTLTGQNSQQLHALSLALKATAQQIRQSEDSISAALGVNAQQIKESAERMSEILQDSAARLEQAEKNLGKHVSELTQMLKKSNESNERLQRWFLIAAAISAISAAVSSGIAWNAPKSEKIPTEIRLTNTPPAVYVTVQNPATQKSPANTSNKQSTAPKH